MSLPRRRAACRVVAPCDEGSVTVLAAIEECGTSSQKQSRESESVGHETSSIETIRQGFVSCDVPSTGVGMFLANQDTELKQIHSGRKAASFVVPLWCWFVLVC